MKQPLQRLLENGLAEGVFTGASAAYALSDAPIHAICAGYTDTTRAIAVTADTLFDIASVTKLFTAAAVLRLHQSGRLPLDIPVGSLGLPSHWKHASFARATIAQLLAHESGLPDWRPLFEAIPVVSRGRPEGRRVILDQIFATPLEAPPGTRMCYSDIGFIALGELLEEVFSKPLSELIAAEVTGPLKLASVHFRPLNEDRFSEGVFAATETCPWLGTNLRGVVHDDNARAMGGVAGHAGLFANAADIATFGRSWLDALEGSSWIDRQLAALAIERRTLGRGLGVDLKSESGSSAGDIAGMRTFGHLGFTGCSLWIDPDARAAISLLTNRVHPTRNNTRIRDFRPVFHNAFFKISREEKN